MKRASLLLLFVSTLAHLVRSQQVAGGLGNVVQVSDPNVAAQNANQITRLKQALVTPIKDQFTAKTGIKPAQFELISYASQVVAGTNYFAKVKIAENDYAHLRIFEPLPYLNKSMELSAVQTGKKLDDPIVYFDKSDAPTVVITTEEIPVAIEILDLPGGLSRTTQVDLTKPAEDGSEVQKLQKVLSTTIKDQFVRKTGITPAKFDMVSYARQVVAGFNYFPKVMTGPNEYVHLRIFESLTPNEPMELSGFQLDKKLSDPIQMFYGEQPLRTTSAPVVIGIRLPVVGGLGRTIDAKSNGFSIVAAYEMADLRNALYYTIRDQYTDKTGSIPSRFELISYAKQVVAGINYFAKVQTEDNEYVHLRIYRPFFSLGGMMELTGIQTGKTLSDPIEYFSGMQTQTIAPPPPIPQSLPGGVGAVISLDDVAASNANAKEIAQLKAALNDPIKQQYVQQTNQTPQRFDLVSYSKQVVAGTNYFAKVRVSDSEYAHLTIFKPLPYTNKPMELTSVQTGKTLADAI